MAAGGASIPSAVRRLIILSAASSIVFAPAVAVAAVPAQDTRSAAAEAVKANPNWDLLWWYAAAGAAACLLVVVVLVMCLGGGGLEIPPADDGTQPERLRSPWAPLSGIGTTWSFKDSIATNAAGAVVLFTGLFGSKDVATTLFGDDGADLVAIGVVSAAITAGLIGLGPVVLLMFQAARADDMHTPVSVGIASAFVLAGSGGLVLVLYETLEAAELAASVRYGLAGMAIAALGVYGVLALYRTLRQGGKPKKAESVELSAMP